MPAISPRRPSSGTTLRRLLAATPGTPGRLYHTEALYRAQVDYTARVLDLVDAFTDDTTAALITSAIYDQLTGGDAEDAAQRERDHAEAYQQLMRQAPTPRTPL